MKKSILKYSLCFMMFLFSGFQSYSQIYCAGDSINLTAVDYIAGDLQWQYSYNNSDWFDIPVADNINYMYYPQEEVYLRLKITDENCLPSYYTDVRHVVITPNATIADAGDDQIDIIGTNTYLQANFAEIGTGFWSIINGMDGEITDQYDNTSEFIGVAGETYVLRWTIYNSCSNSSDQTTISFADNSFTCGEVLTDPRDSKQYTTVEIGSQCWMAENLNVGSMINGTENPSDNAVIEKYCYDNNLDNCTQYGGLYQWDEMMQYSTGESIQGICPQGWHIPSDEEIKTLEMELGMTQIEADANNSWRGPGVGTALLDGGSSGFNILFGGARTNGGGWMYIEGSETYEFGYLYTTTEHLTDNSKAFRRCFRAGSTAVGRYDTFPKTYGFSVRCLKD
jgi:uncharacterized protein (TIGR02145 family)